MEKPFKGSFQRAYETFCDEFVAKYVKLSTSKYIAESLKEAEVWDDNSLQKICMALKKLYGEDAMNEFAGFVVVHRFLQQCHN